jgi:hypothetical protein
MDVQLFHLWQSANEPYGAIMIIAIIAVMIVCGVMGYSIYRRWIGPLVLWPVLSLSFVGFSKRFPENRPQCKQLIVMAIVGSAILTWLVSRIVRKYRDKQEV